MLIGTYSGAFTIVIKENDAWNFKYIWLNLNSISIEDALNIIGKYKNTLYDAVASSTPTSIYGKEEWIHIMFSEPLMALVLSINNCKNCGLKYN